MIQFMWQNPVPAPVSRQKINAPARHVAADDRIGRGAKRRLYFVLGKVRKAFQMIEAAAANYADRWLIHAH
jgi:hypothetical protein